MYMYMYIHTQRAREKKTRKRNIYVLGEKEEKKKGEEGYDIVCTITTCINYKYSTRMVPLNHQVFWLVVMHVSGS